MSGPKISIYDLTAERRAIIAAELRKRKLELEKRQDLLIKIDANSPKIEQLLNDVSKFDMIVQEEVKQLGTSNLEKMISDLREMIHPVQNLISESASLQDNKKLENRLTVVNDKVQQLNNDVGNISKQALLITDQLQEVLSASIEELFQQNNKTIKNSEVNSFHEEQYNKLLSFYDFKYLPENLRQKINVIRGRRTNLNENCLGTFLAVEVQPIIKACEAFVNSWNSFGDQYIRLLCRYEFLAKENGHNEFRTIPFSSTAISELENLIELEENELQRQVEEEYIENTITSVMEDMGYSIQGTRDVVRRNGSHYNSCLFRYNRDSAVNVIFSDDGRITMEVGKTDNSDRIPESNESREIVETMESFCSDFKEIERKLAEKGVILKNRIRLSPPTAEYAQIINLTDYILMEDKSVTASKRRVKKTTKKSFLMD